MDLDEVTSRRIRRRIDSRDGVARARGIYSIVHSLMPARPKFEEELIKNVSGEAKKAQRKRFRLWCLEKLEALRNLIWTRAMGPDSSSNEPMGPFGRGRQYPSASSVRSILG
ncbi:hypothetical protein ACFX2J_035796 [Malus domestica]